MSIPSELKYTSSHEWVRVEGDVAVVGITHHAQESLGDVVFVDMPDEDAELEKGDEAAEIESVKAVSSIYAPVSGTIVAVNGAIDDEPDLVNREPYAGGWLFKIQISDMGELDSLLDAAGYAAETAD